MIGARLNTSFGLVKDSRALEIKVEIASLGTPHNRIFQVAFLPRKDLVRARSFDPAENRTKRLVLVIGARM